MSDRAAVTSPERTAPARSALGALHLFAVRSQKPLSAGAHGLWMLWVDGIIPG